MRFLIHGQIRSGKNGMQTTRTGRHYPRPEWAAWRDQVVMDMKCQDIGKWEKFMEPCHVIVKYWKGDERRRDVPGMMDALWHCLERAGIVSDDKFLESVEWIPMGLDRVGPRVDIEIEAIGEAT